MLMHVKSATSAGILSDAPRVSSYISTVHTYYGTFSISLFSSLPVVCEYVVNSIIGITLTTRQRMANDTYGNQHIILNTHSESQSTHTYCNETHYKHTQIHYVRQDRTRANEWDRRDWEIELPHTCVVNS